MHHVQKRQLVRRNELDQVCPEHWHLEQMQREESALSLAPRLPPCPPCPSCSAVLGLGVVWLALGTSLAAAAGVVRQRPGRVVPVRPLDPPDSPTSIERCDLDVAR
ncbi:hypothetical protein L1887_61162 [Cichorium endivia]|nr:hypothetical protein L1887_61162 [Cichorium endivia]